MKNPSDGEHMRASLDRLLANLGSALNFTPTAVDFALPVPTAIVDLSSCLPGLMPGSDTYTRSVPLMFFLAENIGQLLTDDSLSLTLQSLRVPAGALVVVFPFVEDALLNLHRATLTSGAPHHLTRTIVLVGRSDLMRILTNGDPLREFRNVVLEQIEISWIAPYQDGGAVRGEHGFFGRELELGTIAQYARERSFLVIGGRRIGKSSLLHRLCQTTLPQAGMTTLLLDCQNFETVDDFLRERLQDWWPGPPSEAPAIMADLLENPLTTTPLVVLIDEADKLAALDRMSGWTVHRRLRALSQRPGSRVQFVLAGERTLDEAIRDDAKGPLYNFGTRMLLGCLEFRAVEGLVLHPMHQMGMSFDDELRVVRTIFDFTSGHPNIVQRFCLQLLKMEKVRFSHRISIDDVLTVRDDAGFQRSFLEVLRESSTTLEQIVSLVMVDQPEANTLDSVLEAVSRRCSIAPTATQVEAALKYLVELRSILKPQSNRYIFAIDAFPRVVANTEVLKEKLRVLSEQFLKEGKE